MHSASERNDRRAGPGGSDQGKMAASARRMRPKECREGGGNDSSPLNTLLWGVLMEHRGGNLTAIQTVPTERLPGPKHWPR